MLAGAANIFKSAFTAWLWNPIYKLIIVFLIVVIAIMIIKQQQQA